MARFRPIYTAIWEDEKEFLNYSDQQKVLFFYLITNEKCTESGIYKISIKNVASILNWTTEKTLKTLQNLKPNAFYDPENQCVFIKNFLKYNGFRHGRPDLIAKSIAKDRQNFETSVWDCFLTTYPKFEQTIAKGQRPFYEYDSESSSLNSLKGDARGGSKNADFETFWAAYPKKIGKEGARRAWKRIKEPGNVLELIKTALAWQTKSQNWKREAGKFIPNPETYLNQGRWQDQAGIVGVDIEKGLYDE